MKKILFILAVGFLFSVKADAQVFPLYGTTLDTLTNTDSTSYVVDARNSASIDVIGHLGLTRVSGTGTVTVRVYTQNFNKESARWTHIATTTVGTTATNSLINCLKGAYPGRYVRFTVSQTGTAVTLPRFAAITRLN